MTTENLTSITMTWDVTQMDCYPQADGETDVVFTVHWTCSGSQTVNGKTYTGSVYSTCSLLPEENADRVRAFLQAHPNFTLEPLPTSFPEELRARQTPCGLQLLGCRDGVEGFFIARMRRVR